MEKEMLTVREAAAYLNLNEKLVYRLVRDGRIPGTRITGKWTFPRSLLRSWMESHSLQGLTPPQRREAPSFPEDLFIAGSNDLVIDRLIYLFRKEAPGRVAYFANLGSLGGLRALQAGKAQVAGVHLYHPGSGQYNAPYLQELFPKGKIILFNLAYRVQGFMWQPRRVRAIRRPADLARPGLRLVNREGGSGTRILLDHLLQSEGINPSHVSGYGYEVFTHLEVGLAIMRKEADVGLGIQSVADALGLRFLPIMTERYDVVLPVENMSVPAVQVFLNILHSRKVRDAARGLSGYDLRDTGKMIS